MSIREILPISATLSKVSTITGISIRNRLQGSYWQILLLSENLVLSPAGFGFSSVYVKMNSDQCLCWLWSIVNLFRQECDSTLEQSGSCYGLADGMSMSRYNTYYWWWGVKKRLNQCHLWRKAVGRAPSSCAVQKSVMGLIQTLFLLDNDEKLWIF